MIISNDKKTLSCLFVMILYHLLIFVIILALLASLSPALHLMGFQGFTLMSTHLSLYFFLELFRMLDFFAKGKM